MHSLVFVLVPNDTQDIIAEVSRLLAGSELAPEKVYSTYEQPCSCINSLASADSFKQFDATEEGRKLLSALNQARQDKNRDIENDILLRRFKAVRILEQLHPYYMKVDPACDLCEGTGIYVDSRDPAGHLDYWEIGGRWSGAFGNGTSIVELQDEELRGNIAKVNDIQVGIEPAAIITPDGEWHTGPIVILDELFEPERSEEELRPRIEWSQHIRRLLSQYPDYLAVVVDCHS